MELALKAFNCCCVYVMSFERWLFQETKLLLLCFQTIEFNFHDNHGTYIVLSDDKQTAEMTSDYYNGIVMSRDPMVENTAYEVKN